MKTANDIIMYILNETIDYIFDIIDRHGVSAEVFELSNAERTALAMFEISVNCFT